MRSFESYPDGHFDRGGRWYPSEEERCACCEGIRSPSRAFPYSLLKHCSRKKHYINLCEKLGQKPPEFKKAPRKPVDERNGWKVLVSIDGKFYSPWSLEAEHRTPYEWVPGKWHRQKVKWDWPYEETHPREGLYCFTSEKNAEDYAVNWTFKNFGEFDFDAVHIFTATCRYFQAVNKNKLVSSMMRIDSELVSTSDSD